MNIQATKKTENKSNAKPDTAKTIAEQKKIINQLKQEIKTLTKTIKDMQHNPDTQSFMITIPQGLFIRLNAYLSDYMRNTRETVSLSDFISDAINVYLCYEEQDRQTETQEKLAEKGMIQN